MTDQSVSILCDKASRLIQQGDESRALEFFSTALSQTKNSFLRAGIFNNIGLIYCNRGQLPEALEMFMTAHRLQPQLPDAMANIALAYKWMGDLKSALRWIDRALAIHPWHSAAQFTQAMAVLLSGDFKRGFELYECRFRARAGGLAKLITRWPEWGGSSAEPLLKNVYVYGEQGSGDIFLMLRYARLIREAGMKQSWVVHKSMKTLVQLMPDIDCVVENGEDLPQFDCHIPAASLPRVFGTTIATIPLEPYIPRPDVPRFRIQNAKLNVGIVWRGSRVQTNDRFRSTNLDQWRPVLEVQGVQFHSLQVEGSDEALVYPEIQIHEPPADWMETARRVAAMDLVISVDTSMVHLCGAMGVPCWCALHCRPYFVYPITREDCPWYSSVRLFKQRKEFQWFRVFEDIARQLTEKVTQDSL